MAAKRTRKATRTPVSSMLRRPVKSGGVRWTMPPKLTRNVAYVMVGLAVLGGWLLTPWPVATGLTVLAGVRLFIVWREERKPQPEPTSCANGR